MLGQANFRAIYVECSGDEAVQQALTQIGNLLGSVVNPPAVAIAQLAAPVELGPRLEHTPTKKLRVQRAPRQPKSAAVQWKDDDAKKWKVPEPAKQKPPHMADRIAELIEARGPLSTTRLAQLMATSEGAVRISLGKSKRRFRVDEDQNWHLTNA